MGDKRELVENFRGAVVREGYARLAAFSGLKYPFTVCGEPLRAMTLRDTVEMQIAGSPFWFGGKYDVLDALTVLYIVSRSRAEGEGAREFSRRLAKKFPNFEICQEAENYVADMFLDCGALEVGDTAEKKKQKPPHYLNAAVYVHEIASAYGWAPDTVLSLPLGQVYQYLHLIRAAKDGNYSWRQLSDIEADKIVAERIKRRKGEY